MGELFGETLIDILRADIEDLAELFVMVIHRKVRAIDAIALKIFLRDIRAGISYEGDPLIHSHGPLFRSSNDYKMKHFSININKGQYYISIFVKKIVDERLIDVAGIGNNRIK